MEAQTAVTVCFCMAVMDFVKRTPGRGDVSRRSQVLATACAYEAKPLLSLPFLQIRRSCQTFLHIPTRSTLCHSLPACRRWEVAPPGPFAGSGLRWNTNCNRERLGMGCPPMYKYKCLLARLPHISLTSCWSTPLATQSPSCPFAPLPPSLWLHKGLLAHPPSPDQPH